MNYYSFHSQNLDQFAMSKNKSRMNILVAILAGYEITSLALWHSLFQKKKILKLARFISILYSTWKC